MIYSIHSIAGKMSRYVYDLQHQGFKISALADKDVHIQYFISIDTIEEILDIMRIVNSEILIQKYPLYRKQYLDSKYPNFDYPKYEIMIHDGYMY